MDCCTSTKPFDLAIIGGGSAAFAAAIRAADLGARPVIIERGTLGGTCVNVGCVPSKALLRAAEAFHRAGHHPFRGIHATVSPPDLASVVAQKDELVEELRREKYQNVLEAYPQITLLKGEAAFERNALHVNGAPVSAAKLILATGARPWFPPISGLESVTALTSTEALALQELPASMIVLGGGAVGVELAQLFARLGTKVTIVETLPHIVPAEDPEVGDALASYLRAEGIDVRVMTRVVGVAPDAAGVRVDVQVADATESLTARHLLVATGRRPNTGGLGLERTDIALGRKGEILVNEHLETTHPGIYAAGDVIGDPMFVYVAAYAGSLAAENALAGNTRKYDVSVVPRVTFTDPAVASVGLDEHEARARGMGVLVSKLPLSHVPRSIAARDTRGFIKLVADEATNLLVGAHVLASEAGEIIQEAVIAIRFGIRVDEIAATMHPYLTLAEGFKLAAQTFKKDVAKLSCCAA